MVARTWRYAAGLALLGALAGGLVGCTSGPAGPGSTGGPTGGATSVPATSAATSPSSGTATGSATGTLAYPADVPAEARVNSPAGAMAFARYFFAQVNKAYTTPQAGLIAPLSTANCKTCATYEGNSLKYVQLHQRHTLEPVQVTEVSIAPDTPDDVTRTVDVVFVQRPSQIVDSVGAVVETLKSRQAIFAVDLVWDGSLWRVSGIQVRQG
ncbi:MAG: hypothetical protein IPJ15_00140 [Actinomycetales bacterium]|nr:hypothetical protein [Candidatus Phosphoribacter baldrii]